MMYLVASDGDTPAKMYFVNDVSDVDAILKDVAFQYLDLFDKTGKHTGETWKYNYSSQNYYKM